MHAAEFPEWLDATVVEDQEGAPSRPSPFDDVTEVSSELQMLALVQAEPGPVLIIRDADDPAEDVCAVDPAEALRALSPVENVCALDPAENVPAVDLEEAELPFIDAEELEPIESLAASIREPPIVRQARLLFASLAPLIARLREQLARSRAKNLFAALVPLIARLREQLAGSRALPLIARFREQLAASRLIPMIGKLLDLGRSRLKTLFAALPPLIERLRDQLAGSRLKSLFASLGLRLQPAATAATSMVRSKIPRLAETSTNAVAALRSVLPSSSLPPSTNDQDALPLLAEQHSRQRIATIAVWVAIGVGVVVLGSRIVALFDF